MQLLNRASDVKMHQFITCICDEDYTVLNPGGGASTDDLNAAWETLFFEYTDLINNGEASHKIKLAASIIRDDNILECSRAWIEAIKLGLTTNTIPALRKIGFEYDFDINDPDSLQSDIEEVEAELRLLSLNLKVMRSEYEALLANEKNTAPSKAVERKYFEEVFQAINNYRKWNAVNEQSTVLQFCVALKSYNDAVASLKNAA